MLLLTVPHTGTNTAQEILGPCDREHLYLHKRCQERIKTKVKQHPFVITTMRNPLDVASGWMKRQRELDEFFPMWESLMKWRSEAKEAYWLPVDTPDRDDYLQVIAERIGREIKTDWPKLNEKHGPMTTDEDYTLDDVRDFCRKRGWFDQFGYEI